MKKIFLIAVSAVALTALLLSLAGCASIDYSRAKSYMEKGNYADARTLLEPITDYKDAFDMLYDCNYKLLYNYVDANGQSDGSVKSINKFFQGGEKGDYTLYAETDDGGLHLSCRTKEVVGLVAVYFRLDLPESAGTVRFTCQFETAGNVLSTRTGTVDITTAKPGEAALSFDASTGDNPLTSITDSMTQTSVSDCFDHILENGDSLLQQTGTGVTLASLGFYATAEPTSAAS